jgi:hypothetical protein
MKINNDARESAADLVISDGGAKRARTADPLLAKQVLFQLSYSPKETALQRHLILACRRVLSGRCQV